MFVLLANLLTRKAYQMMWEVNSERVYQLFDFVSVKVFIQCDLMNELSSFSIVHH